MFIEFLTWSTVSATPTARKAGLVAETAGIAGRYRRHKRAWRSHLGKSATFIEQNLTKVDPAKPILILGSGLCLDLPLNALNQHPAGTILLDAVIPFSARLKCWKLKNIRFACSDITGFLAHFWQSEEGQSVAPPDIAPFPEGDYGMVISCNILSQLPLSFANSPPADDMEKRLTASIQLAHIRALNALKCPLVLITDYERLESEDANGNTIPTVAPHLLPGEPQKEWLWHIAPDGGVRGQL